jgi:hypothetical protein
MDGAGLQGWTLRRVEARVWPGLGKAWQDALEKLQDLFEALPLWRPFICYHAALWRRKGKA